MNIALVYWSEARTDQCNVIKDELAGMSHGAEHILPFDRNLAHCAGVSIIAVELIKFTCFVFHPL